MRQWLLYGKTAKEVVINDRSSAHTGLSQESASVGTDRLLTEHFEPLLALADMHSIKPNDIYVLSALRVSIV